MQNQKVHPQNLVKARFFIDGRHQRARCPSMFFSYYPTEYFSFKLNKDSFNSLYVIDLNGIIRYISDAYLAARNDSSIFSIEREKILKFLKNLLILDGHPDDPVIILSDGGFPSNSEEIINKQKLKCSKVQTKIFQSSRNKVEQTFGHQANVFRSTRQRFEFSSKHIDDFQKAAAFLVNIHIKLHPISLKYQEIFEAYAFQSIDEE